MISCLIEKIKKYRKFLFYIGVSFVVLGIIGVILIKNYDAFILAGVGIILWAPDFFFSAREYKEKFGKPSLHLVSSLIELLCFGFFLIILALFIL